MKFVFARPQDETAIKQLLEANDLLHRDIEPADLIHYLMARNSSGLIGLVGLEIRGDCALFRSLVVNRDYRHKGLATLLVDRIEKYARSLKISTLYLLTMTAEDFFKKRAFRATARETAPAGIQNTAEFGGLCPVSAAFMTKQI